MTTPGGEPDNDCPKQYLNWYRSTMRRKRAWSDARGLRGVFGLCEGVETRFATGITVSKYSALLLAVIAATLTRTAEASETWVEVRSPNFTVITDTNEKVGRRVVGQFERMRSVLEELYPQLES